MKSIWFGVALSLSVASVACGDASSSDNTTVDDSAEVVAAQPLTDAGKSAMRALLGVSRTLFHAAGDPSAAAFSQLAQASLSEGYVHPDANGGSKYFFEALVLEGGDIVTGNLQLVITETRGDLGFEAGPTYSARISTEARPNGGRMLDRNDLRAAGAILGLAREAIATPSSENSGQFSAFVSQDVMVEAITVKALPKDGTQFTLTGLLLYGGDVVAGTAKLVIDETLVDDTMGLGKASVYKATTTIQE